MKPSQIYSQQKFCPNHGKIVPCQSCQDILNQTYTPPEASGFDRVTSSKTTENEHVETTCSPDTELEKEVVKHLVDRFLGWRLPRDFHPDCGISFGREYNVSYNANQGLPPSIHEPTGTNLFTADQAKEMFRFLLEREDGTPFLSSRDTYWKERVRKEVEGMRREVITVPPKGTPNRMAKKRNSRINIGFNQALDTLLDNLK